MAVKGVFNSDQHITGEKKGDFAGAILRTEPTGNAPLLALSSGMQEAGAADVVVTWFEEGFIAGRQTIVTGGNAAATSFPIDDASFYIVGVVLLVEATGEYLFINGITGNTITVDRGFGGTAAQTIADGSKIQRIGTAFEEASNRPPGVVSLGEPHFNYMQIFRNAWDVSGTAQAVQYLTGSREARSRAQAARYHAEDIERSLIWGKRFIGRLNNQPIRTMDGINSQITTNVTVAPNPTAWSDVDTFLQQIFSWNIQGKPNERITFAGNQALSVLNKIAINNGNIKLDVGATEFGMNITKWITPFGTISVVTHPLMNVNPLWSKDLYVYHPGAIEMRWLRKTFNDDYDKNGTRAGRDADYGVVTSELCITYKAEKTGGKLLGLTAAA